MSPTQLWNKTFHFTADAVCSNQCRPNLVDTQKPQKQIVQLIRGIWSFAIRKYISQSKPCDKGTVQRGVKFLLWVLLNGQDVWGVYCFHLRLFVCCAQFFIFWGVCACWFVRGWMQTVSWEFFLEVLFWRPPKGLQLVNNLVLHGVYHQVQLDLRLFDLPLFCKGVQ